MQVGPADEGQGLKHLADRIEAAQDAKLSAERVKVGAVK